MISDINIDAMVVMYEFNVNDKSYVYVNLVFLI